MVSVQIKILSVPTSSVVHVSQKAETLTIHSLLTIKNTAAIKINLRNVRKQQVFAQLVTYENTNLETSTLKCCFT